MKKLLKLMTVLVILILTLNYVPIAAHNNNNSNHNCNVSNDKSGNHYDAENCNDKEIVYVDRIVYIDKIVEKIVYVDKIVEKVVYVDKIVEKIVYVDKPVIEYRDKIIYKDKIVEKIVYVDKEETIVEKEEAPVVVPVECACCSIPEWIEWAIGVAAIMGLINFALLLKVVSKKNKVAAK